MHQLLYVTHANCQEGVPPDSYESAESEIGDQGQLIVVCGNTIVVYARGFWLKAEMKSFDK